MTGSKTQWYGFTGGGIILLVVLLLTRFGGYFVPFLSLITVTGIGIIFYMAGIRWSFPVVICTLPLSVSMPLGAEHQVQFPSELLVSALGISVILYLLLNPEVLFEWISRPVSVCLFASLFFMMIAMLFSEMPVVSVKSVFIKTVYLISFYGGAYLYCREGTWKPQFIKYYLVPMIIVIAYVLTRHAQFEFSKDVTGYVTKPFYQDHTIYSAAMAFLLPFVLLFAWNGKGILSVFYSLCAMLLFAALMFAVSRAAWISIGIATIVWLLMKSRAPSLVIAALFIATFTFLYIKSDEMLFSIQSNRYDSGARNAGIEEQTKSVLNITNDQSNAERLNRWKCALRMFREKPFTGFGPGTYQFQYLSFQREDEMTRISVKTPYDIQEGRGGTAHNEFLLVLSESGIMAAIFFTLSVILVFSNAFKSCRIDRDNGLQLAFLFAFTTFTVHSLFNNFLDTDKTAALFYYAMAFFSVTRMHSYNPVHGE